jgi:hypothetical protein
MVMVVEDDFNLVGDFAPTLLIGSANSMGTQSDFSPPFQGEEKYSTLGEAVLGASLKSCSEMLGYDPVTQKDSKGCNINSCSNRGWHCSALYRSYLAIYVWERGSRL